MSLEVAFAYFMFEVVTVTVLVGMTSYMTLEGPEVAVTSRDPVIFREHKLGQTDHILPRDIWDYTVGRADV